MTLGNMRQMTLGKLWHSQLAPAAVICLTILVSGCAESDLFSPVEPGKYDFLDCPSIAKQLAATSYEEAKLARLMTRASEAADFCERYRVPGPVQHRACAVAIIAQSRGSQKMFAFGPEPAADYAARELICRKQPASTSTCGRTGKPPRPSLTGKELALIAASGDPRRPRP